MRKSASTMRCTILSNLFTHLKANYDFERPEDSFMSGQISDHEIDILLAFKSDSRLGELRGALSRLENGTYGICIGCKKIISQADLDVDPTRRICAACEKGFSQRTMESFAAHSHR